MQRHSKLRALAGLAVHFAMGAALGLALALALLWFDIAHVGDMILGGFDPRGTLTVFVGSLTLHFAVGATLTGFVLSRAGQ